MNIKFMVVLGASLAVSGTAFSALSKDASGWDVRSQEDPPFLGSDYLRVYNPQGGIFAEKSVTDAEEISNPDFLFYIDNPTLANSSMFGSYTAVLGPTGQLDDVFGVAHIGTDYQLFFISAFPGGDPAEQFGGPHPFTVQGTDGPFDATKYLAANLVSEGYTAQFYSTPQNGGGGGGGGGGGDDVPDGGASLGLLGLGLAGLLTVRRKV